MSRLGKVVTALLAPVLASAAFLATSGVHQSPAAGSTCSKDSSLNLPQGQSASRRPVIFVHGWTSNGTALTKAGAALYSQTGKQISTYYFDYADNATTWAANPVVSGCLATYIQLVSKKYHDAGGDGRVILVGHSMGGLAALYASATTSSLIGGLVTFDTPYLGSPFGNTGVAGWWQGVRQSLGKSIVPPKGSDAQVCLATHDRGSALPNACKYDLPPYLPAATRIDAIGGDVSIRRTFLGIHLYDFSLDSDGIVTVPSSHGYLSGEAGGKAPAHISLRLLTDRCTVSNDAVLGLIRNTVAPSAAGLAESAILDVLTDNSAMNGIQSGKLTPGLVTYLGAATVLAPCSHIHVYNDQSALNEATQALKDDLAALAPSPPPSNDIVRFDGIGALNLTMTSSNLTALGYQNEGNMYEGMNAPCVSYAKQGAPSVAVDTATGKVLAIHAPYNGTRGPRTAVGSIHEGSTLAQLRAAFQGYAIHYYLDRNFGQAANGVVVSNGSGEIGFGLADAAPSAYQSGTATINWIAGVGVPGHAPTAMEVGC